MRFLYLILTRLLLLAIELTYPYTMKVFLEYSLKVLQYDTSNRYYYYLLQSTIIHLNFFIGTYSFLIAWVTINLIYL